MRNLSIQLKSKKYVSFDIFDTLIQRLVKHPHQVFSLMEQYACNNGIVFPVNFSTMRVQAEHVVAKRQPFYTIYDIYDELSLFAPRAICDVALQMEIKAELDLCVPNPDVIELFKACVDGDHHVVITSDTYLPETVLQILLKKCGIVGYKNIFVSCDCKADKQTGSLFHKVLSDLQISANDLIHIGDNKKSDFVRPKLLGIASVLYQHKNNKLYNARCKSMMAYQNQQTFIDRMLDLRHSVQKDNNLFQLGYAGMGPLLFGFTKWLDKCFFEDNIETVLFLSRDGKIMSDAYDLFGGTVSHQYFYASRRALIVPTLWKHPDIEDVFKLFFTSRVDTVQSILEKLGLVATTYEMKLDEYDLSLNSSIDWDNINQSRFADFYNSIKDIIVANSKKQYDLLCDYFRQSGCLGNVAIVDIGWHGNMQRAIVEVLNDCGINAIVHGYYIGIRPDSKTIIDNNLTVRGYLFEKNHEDLIRYEKSINTLVEFIFSTTHGTVLGYRWRDDDQLIVDPIFDQYEYTLCEEADILLVIQEAALSYISDIMGHRYVAAQFVSPDVAFANLIEIGMHPSMLDLAFVGDLRIVGSDGALMYVAKPQSLLFYLKHIKCLKADLQNTRWRVGFFKRLFKLPLPYAELYFLMRQLTHQVD